MATSSNQQWLPYDMVDGLQKNKDYHFGSEEVLLCLPEIAVDLYQKLKRDKIYPPPPNVIILPCSHGMKREKRGGQQSGNLTPYNNNVYYTAKMNMART